MIRLERLEPVLAGYKAYFPSHWKDEKYKWEAVKHFQDHWDIDAGNFGDMFKQATDKTFNLLASGYAYPRGMITSFAKADDEGTRSMFRKLYDESVSLEERIEAFQAAAENMRARYDDGTWRNHYQNTNAISTYLWLRYPDKYYIYKYELFRAAAAELSLDYMPRRNGSADNLTGGFRMYDEICEVIAADESIREMIQQSLTPSCYPDPKMKTATIDVGFYLARFYFEARKSEKAEAEWFPNNYSPNLTVNDWLSLMGNPAVFTPDSLQIMKRMKDYGGQATCTQLAVKYGGNKNFYNAGSSSLAKRVAKATDCETPPDRDNGKAQWWPILYVGRNAVKEEEGSYIWRLRPELSEAIERADLSNVELYAKDEKTETAGGEFDFIRDTIRDENPLEQPDASIQKYSREDFLSKVYMTEERYDVLEALLRNKMNVILQGAPGVGKTFTARKLAYAMMGETDDSRIEMVQFHQNYSYEDFIMGYRPDGDGFKLTDGIFYRFCQTASNHPDKEYFFIIDEINRGNMSKIFGELLMLIEKDYRGTKATLAYSGMPFSVPENLYIIGMMNTADRSLAMIDYALRRRFSFFEMEPGFNSDGFTAYQRTFANETFDALIDQIKILNREITEDKALGRGFQIGHSYFCGRETAGCTDEWMRSVVEFDILPMLGEYWFDEPAKLQRWERNLRGVFDD